MLEKKPKNYSKTFILVNALVSLKMILLESFIQVFVFVIYMLRLKLCVQLN